MGTGTVDLRAGLRLQRAFATTARTMISSSLQILNIGFGSEPIWFVQRPAIFLHRRLPCPAFQEADLGRRRALWSSLGFGVVFWIVSSVLWFRAVVQLSGCCFEGRRTAHAQSTSCYSQKQASLKAGPLIPWCSGFPCFNRNLSRGTTTPGRLAECAAESEADRQSVSTGGAILQFLIALWHTTDVAAIGIGAMVNN